MTEISSHGNICATCYDGEILLHSRYIDTRVCYKHSNYLESIDILYGFPALSVLNLAYIQWLPTPSSKLQSNWRFSLL